MTSYDGLSATIAADTYRNPVADFDDYFQEARLAAHLATQEWDPAFGVPEAAFVALRVRCRVRDTQRRNVARTRHTPTPLDPADFHNLPTPEVDDDWPLLCEVGQAMPHLPWLEEIVVTLHYCAGLTHKTIGRALGFTESRSCQIARSGVRKLRSLLV